MITLLALITVVGMAHQLAHLLEYISSGQAWEDTADDGDSPSAYYLHMTVEFSRVLCPLALAVAVLVL